MRRWTTNERNDRSTIHKTSLRWNVLLMVLWNWFVVATPIRADGPLAGEAWAAFSDDLRALSAVALDLRGGSIQQNLVIEKTGRLRAEIVAPGSSPDADSRWDRFSTGTTVYWVEWTPRFLLKRLEQNALAQKKPAPAAGTFLTWTVDDPLGEDTWMRAPWPLLDLVVMALSTDQAGTIERVEKGAVLRVPSLGLTLYLEHGHLARLRAEPCSRYPGRGPATIEFMNYRPVPGSEFHLPSRIVETVGGPNTPSVVDWTVANAQVNPADLEDRVTFDSGRLRVVPAPTAQSPSSAESVGRAPSAIVRPDQGNIPMVTGASTPPPLGSRTWQSPSAWGWALAGFSALFLLGLLARRALAR